MSPGEPGDLSNVSMLDLFRMETEAQVAAMTGALLALETNPGAAHLLEALMRGAHSLKGAARIVNRNSAVWVAHALEDRFVAAQRGKLVLAKPQIDLLLQGVDLLSRIAGVPEADISAWEAAHRNEIELLTGVLKHDAPFAPEPGPPRAESEPPAAQPAPPSTAGRALRVTPENLNRLLGLAGELVVSSRAVDNFSARLVRLKRLHDDLARSIEAVQHVIEASAPEERLRTHLAGIRAKAAACREHAGLHAEELESFDRRFDRTSRRLYQEVLACRMRPFSDGVQSFPRMVRDLSHALGKEVKLEIIGESTPVDRDILDRIEPTVGHLLRNALDHGIESPAGRRAAGKPACGRIRIKANHHAGMLFITIDDDGRGIDAEAVRRTVLEKELSRPEVAATLSDAELIEFLFLPGFTVKETVTEISGRGVGLDLVQSVAREVGGSVRVESQPGLGMKVELQLPLTLSVMRTLLVEIAGEPYAFPLSRITSAARVPRGEIESIEDRQHFTFQNQQVGLIAAHQVLGLEQAGQPDDELSVIILDDKARRHGIVVDRFLGERELVVRPIDPRLGKIKDISAVSVLPDQSPVLIIDIEDLIRSAENLISGGRLAHIRHAAVAGAAVKRKRVLVIDDSLTVRELERKLIASRGYEVETAVDGMDGWHAVRTGPYDLVVTDVDMPRLDGVDLVRLIKNDPRLKSLPVMIVSYKDRPEDRRRGLDAGADFYLTKGSFHDETLLNAVSDLIGGAVA